MQGMGNVITGLDIGTSSIKGVVATQKKDGSLSIITVFKRPAAGMRKGVLIDPEEALKVLREIIVDLEKISKRATQNIFVNINGEHVNSRPSRGIVAVSRADQEIQQDDVDRVIQASQAVKLLPNYTILHNLVSEFFVDDVGDIKDSVGMIGNRLEVSTLIIEAFVPHINTVVKTIKKAGGEVGGVIFGPLAASRAVLSKRQKDLGVLLVDFGAGTTSFVVYEEGKVVYSKSVPVGSAYVTNDIAIGLKTSIDLAEKLKSSYGFSVSKEVSRREKIKLSEVDPASRDIDTEISRRFLAEIIEVRLQEIFDLINSELKSLGRPVQLPAGIVMVGGGTKLAGMNELARDELRLPAQVGFPDVGSLEVLNPTHREVIEDPEFATALGLLFQGNEELRQPATGLSVVKKFFRSLIP